LKVGDRFTLTSIIYPCTLELTVAGIYAGTADDRNMLFITNTSTKPAGRTARSALVGEGALHRRDAARDRSDQQAFENTSAEVRAETERAFALSFVSMMATSRCSSVGFALPSGWRCCS